MLSICPCVQVPMWRSESPTGRSVRTIPGGLLFVYQI
jgi:hypothetical protein